MLKGFFIFLTISICTVMALAGFRNHHFLTPPLEIFSDMAHQAKLKPQSPSDFYANGAATREPVPQTLPIGYQFPDASYDPHNPQFSQNPPILTPQTLQRGQERFQIYCSICHGPQARGDGLMTQYGFSGIANLTQRRFQELPDSDIFQTLTSGKNRMPAWGSQLSISDRWAIIAYIRLLQKQK